MRDLNGPHSGYLDKSESKFIPTMRSQISITPVMPVVSSLVCESRSPFKQRQKHGVTFLKVCP